MTLQVMNKTNSISKLIEQEENWVKTVWISHAYKTSLYKKAECESVGNALKIKI